MRMSASKFGADKYNPPKKSSWLFFGYSSKPISHMRNLIIICLLCIPLRMQGQEDEGTVIIRNSLDLTYLSIAIDNPFVTDTVNCIVDYAVRYVPDTLDMNSTYKDVYQLEIGRRYSRFYGRIEYLSDSISSVWKRYGRPNDYAEQRCVLRQYHPLYWEIVEDRENAAFTTLYRYPSGPPVVFYAYKVDKERLQWTLTHHVRDICGYRCFRAFASFGGRKWIAWFAPELPLNSAVWKLWGLPGLVLAFEDTQGHYKFECTAIRTCNQPMVEYKRPRSRLSRKDWMRLIELIHADPLNSLEKGNTVYYKPTLAEPAEQLTSWTIPYNPIELE